MLNVNVLQLYFNYGNNIPMTIAIFYFYGKASTCTCLHSAVRSMQYIIILFPILFCSATIIWTGFNTAQFSITDLFV